MRAISRRVAAVERILEASYPTQTVLTESGSFECCDPIGYVDRHGRTAPDGSLIVGLEVSCDFESWDGLSQALWYLENDICAGVGPDLRKIGDSL